MYRHPFTSSQALLSSLALVSLLVVSLAAPRPAAAQDEPGAPAVPGAKATPAPGAKATSAPSATSRPAADSLDGLLVQAQASCRPAAPCPLLPRLLAALARPAASLRVMPLLARIGDPRAVAPLAWLAAYGSGPQRRAARRALRRLARAPAAVRALRRVVGDVDPALRARARAVLTGPAAPAGPVAQAVDREGDARKTRAARGAPPALKRAAGPPASSRADARASDPGRVVYGASALTRPPGSLTWSAHNLGAHFFDYTLSEHVEIGGGFALPVMVYGFLARLKLSTELTEGVRAGVLLTGGAFGSYVEEHHGLAAYGGGPVLTFGSERLFVNASFMFGARSTYGDDESCYRGYCYDDDEDNTRWIGLANLGFSWRVGRWLRLNLELFMPLHQGADAINGKMVVMMYGVRIFGERIFGDIAMMYLFQEDLIVVHEYMPLGVPYLTFGYRW